VVVIECREILTVPATVTLAMACKVSDQAGSQPQRY
jgi:hypothetical protein